MFKKLMLAGLLNLSLFSAASAESYWVNIVTFDSSSSYQVSSEENCMVYVMQFAQAELGGSVSCDVNPLPTANNLPNDEKV